MEYQTLIYELADDLAVITLDRPDVLNALNAQMRAELRDALSRAGQSARAVVLTGAGQAFCSGQDLGQAGAGDGASLEQVLLDEYAPLVRAMVDCPVPVMAAVNGAAAGAGANLALMADVVIAAERASFLQAFTRVGLVPDAASTWMLPRLVGPARAMGAALFAERIEARQAADWGMIWEAVPDDLFDAHWRARAAHLAKGPTLAYGALRRLMRESWANDIEVQFSREAAAQGQCARSRDFREGLVAFAEKRPPRFEGR
ncbi:enoyl-CoA hydratase-related protein [Alkalilacustris brevis]|uniref:enoyl-CoA hydratase-related protein n=1 Tax=Alkalilacustris brevis TaxID=2026338 RepID=UPI000E0D39FD|nr:enoyl-CoA hydratase-related protein [Alkalilacustris brevis]